ncbi:MAG TPA: carboxypeptidase-like regulatory domain-containing protein [Cyclobacteriaceae bacterium]|nr:carboxypeptidase-like regulatory domain-containing protein [Cyclobacteriaceae bacterium]
MNSILRNVPIFIFLLSSFFAGAQTVPEEKISGVFSGLSFERFARMVEDKSNYRFYFKDDEVDSLLINVTAFENTIRQILDNIFSGTDLQYAIDHQFRIFISRNEKLTLNLSPGYFTLRPEVTEEEDEVSRENPEERVFAKNRLWEIGRRGSGGSHAKIAGKVQSVDSGEPIIGAIIYPRGQDERAITDESGAYSISLPKGRHTLIVQSFGAYQEQRQINLMGNGTLNIEMDDNIISLSEVVVTSKKSANIERPEMGLASISVQSLKKVPAVLGEVDVIKGILTLPGVKTVGEASVGFNVRGGAADQNLILFNQSTIYNPTHLFGLFSAFNPDLVESVDLYKAGIPVQFGGRLSSVLDVKVRFGDEEKISGGGGLGLMTSRLYLHGPIGKKTTFALGGRTTYSNWLIGLLEEESEFRDSRASFYDFNLNLKQKINENNEIKLFTYASRDGFRLDSDTTFSYENQNISLSWVHFYNERLESEITAGHDHYNFQILGEQNPLNEFTFGFSMNQSHFRTKFVYELDDRHRFTFGMDNVYYNLSPGTLLPSGEESIVIRKVVGRERALETAIYFGDEYEINPSLTVSYGLRYALYNFLGPNSVNQYPLGVIKSESTLIGRKSYGEGDIIHTEHGPEVRLSARYSFDNVTSVKLGYNTMRQHIHMLTNTSAISPTDTWKLSDPHVAPQTGDQLAIGYFKNFKNNTVETSIEVYGRRLMDLMDFRSGATLILNEAVEQAIINTEGKTYGVELMAKKTEGKLNGWISYTYSRSLLRSASSEVGEKINRGKYYRSNFDQPHDIMVVANYELSKRINTSLNTNYSTGRPITLPIAKFEYGGADRVFYSGRNAYRIPHYFRVDFSINIEGSHKVRKLAHASWSLGVYNVLGRSNPYSVYFTPVNGILQGYQLSIFARPIPFITYNFRF